MKKNVLITGGSGFIGSTVKENLKHYPFEILTIGHNNGEDLQIDLNSAELKNVFLDFKPDIVCHFASGSNIARANEDKEKEFKNTVESTQNLITSLISSDIKPEKFIYLSSQSVYGTADYLPVDEKHPTKPTTAYGENKLKSEDLIINSGINYLIFRISSIYGLNQNHLKSGVIAKFINNLKTNTNPVVFNSLELFSDFIYIEDVASAILLAIETPSVKNQIFNLASGKPTTLKELLDILYNYFPSAPEPLIKTNTLYPSKEQKGLYLDTKKINDTLGWSCKYNIYKGLQHLLKDVSTEQKISINK